MAPDEIGFAELRAWLRRSWMLALGGALLCGLLAFGAFTFLWRDVYPATARLLVLESARTWDRRDVVRAFLASDDVLGQTVENLAAEGLLAADDSLVNGQNVTIRVVAAPPGGDSPGGSVVLLTAFSREPKTAAAIVNTWATVFLERSQSLLRGTASETRTVLAEQLSPTRRQLEELAAERTRLLDEFQEREEKIWIRRDRQISTTRKRDEQALADFQGETRRLMDEAVVRHLPDDSEVVAPSRATLLEAVSIRAQLARTPRLLTLEKAATDETLAELIVRGDDAEGFDNTLVTQEINPLHDELSLRALEIESELKTVAGERLAEVSSLLVELEKLQLERAAGLVALLRKSDLELRTLRRQRSHALRALTWERAQALAEVDRQFEPLADLESQLNKRLNTAAISELLEEVESVRFAGPAVVPRVPAPKDAFLKIAVASFLGGILGMLIALFRSPGDPSA